MGLKTFFPDATKGKQKFEELRRLSNETTFGVDELTQSFTELANVGVEVSEINDRLMMLGNISGGNKQKFAELVSIYSKIESTGKAGSMQLQQLATRGVPIYKMLKEMGVTGQATGKQITEAFQKMTSEGGQFAGAMDNINKTIEGKQGFISDYFKEMTVNFGELSGIIDLYKGSLDVLKEAIGSVSDKLLEWNNNPVMKGLVQGTLAAGISTLSVVIGVTLVSAIKTLNSKLKETVILKSILDPKTLGIALAIGGIVGITTALIGAKKSSDALKKSAEETSKALKNLTPVQIADNSYKNALKYLETLKNKKKELLSGNAEDTEIIAATSYTDRKGNLKFTNKAEYDSAKRRMETRQAELDIIDSSIEKAQKLVDIEKKGLEDRQTLYTIAEENSKSYSEMLEKIKETLGDTDEGKIAELKNTIKEYTDFLKTDGQQILNEDGTLGILTISNEDVSKTKKAIDKLKKEILKLDPVESLKDTNKTLRDIINSTNTLSDKLLLLQAIEKGIPEEKRNEWIEQQKINNELNTTLNILKQEAEIYDKLQNGDISGYLQGMQELSGSKLKTGNTGVIGSYTGYSVANAAISSSGDASNFANGMAQGGIWGGIISTVIGAIQNVVGELESFQKVMNPVTTWFKKLQPVFEVLFNLLGEIVDIIGIVFSAISDVVLALKPLFNVIQSTLKVFKALFNGVGSLLKLLEPLINIISSLIEALVNGLFGWLFDLSDGINDLCDSTESASDELTKTTEQLKSLSSAMYEQELIYLTMKKRLNADTYASDVTNVHDMILTPQGKFRTDPDDTIFAMKHPETLATSRSANVSVTVNNTMSDKADVQISKQQDANGLERLIVQISQKVASDYANGSNGWDNAQAYNQLRQAGRTLTY